MLEGIRTLSISFNCRIRSADENVCCWAAESEASSMLALASTVISELNEAVAVVRQLSFRRKH